MPLGPQQNTAHIVIISATSCKWDTASFSSICSFFSFLLLTYTVCSVSNGFTWVFQSNSWTCHQGKSIFYMQSPIDQTLLTIDSVPKMVTHSTRETKAEREHGIFSTDTCQGRHTSDCLKTRGQKNGSGLCAIVCKHCRRMEVANVPSSVKTAEEWKWSMCHRL